MTEQRIYKRYRGHVRGCAPPDTPFARADLRTLLTQPIYVGRVRHKDLIYPAVHEAIIDVPTFDQAARVLSELSAEWRKRRPRPLPYLLQGLLQSPQGEPFTAEHAKHHARGPRFYRFPTPTGEKVRVAERSADEAVLNALCDFLLNVHRAHEFGTASSRHSTVPRLVAKLRSGSREQAKAILYELVEAVYMDHASMRIRVRAAGTGGLLREDTDVNVCLRTKGARSHMRVLTETGTRRPDPSLVRLIGCASAWLDDLVTGRSKSLMAIARREGLSLSHVSNTIELAFLAPDLKQAILEGRQPLGLTVTSLQRAVPLPLSWAAQRRRFTRLA